jgi:hypothetical protein
MGARRTTSRIRVPAPGATSGGRQTPKVAGAFCSAGVAPRHDTWRCHTDALRLSAAPPLGPGCRGASDGPNISCKSASGHGRRRSRQRTPSIRSTSSQRVHFAGTNLCRRSGSSYECSITRRSVSDLIKSMSSEGLREGVWWKG